MRLHVCCRYRRPAKWHSCPPYSARDPGLSRPQGWQFGEQFPAKRRREFNLRFIVMDRDDAIKKAFAAHTALNLCDSMMPRCCHRRGRARRLALATRCQTRWQPEGCPGIYIGRQPGIRLIFSDGSVVRRGFIMFSGLCSAARLNGLASDASTWTIYHVRTKRTFAVAMCSANYPVYYV